MKASEIMKELRCEACLTQKELAEKLNLGQATIASYEKGTREPHILSLIAYADFFDCSIDYLVGREGNSVKKEKQSADNLISEMVYKFSALDMPKKMRVLAYIDLLESQL